MARGLRRVGRWARQTVVFLVALTVYGFFAFMMVGGGIALATNGTETIAGAFDDPRANVRCSTPEASHCVTAVAGVVEGYDEEYDNVLVAYDDGVKHKSVSLIRKNRLETGTRVELEYRDGQIVSLYEPRGRRRYHTEDWPRHWHDVLYGVLILGIGVLLLGASSAVAVRWALRRLRRQPAATS